MYRSMSCCHLERVAGGVWLIRNLWGYIPRSDNCRFLHRQAWQDKHGICETMLYSIKLKLNKTWLLRNVDHFGNANKYIKCEITRSITLCVVLSLKMKNTSFSISRILGCSIKYFSKLSMRVCSFFNLSSTKQFVLLMRCSNLHILYKLYSIPFVIVGSLDIMRIHVDGKVFMAFLSQATACDDIWHREWGCHFDDHWFTSVCI